MLAATLGFDLLTGGGRGMMADVSQAFFEASPRRGLDDGIVPATVRPRRKSKGQKTRRNRRLRSGTGLSQQVGRNCDIHAPARLWSRRKSGDQSRNHINVLSADVIVAFPGQEGTLSEIWLATQYGVPVVAYGTHHGEPPFAIPYTAHARRSSRVLESVQATQLVRAFVTRDPHEPDIDRNPSLPTSNAVCSSCHAPIASAPARHTRHAADSTGSACVACHMPRTVISLRSRMPDHTISVPAPENTIAHSIPNACNECHQDRDAAWAAGKLAEWFPQGRHQQLIARADTFASARRGEASALAGLIPACN